MATKTDKKNAIRQGIIVEVSFPVDHFLHLTGVETNLSAHVATG